MKFNVRFTINRFPMRNMYRAIEMVEKSFLFPNDQPDAENVVVETPKSFFNRDIEKNAEQKMAVNDFSLNIFSIRKNYKLYIILYYFLPLIVLGKPNRFRGRERRALYCVWTSRNRQNRDNS